MHLQVPSYICAFQERKRERKKNRKKKGRVLQSNRRLFIILSLIYRARNISFFFSFFKYLFHSLFVICIISRMQFWFDLFFFFFFFFFFFSFTSQPLLCYRRATACTCDYSASKVNLCSNKSCIYSKEGKEGWERMGWGEEKLQEFCPLSRFNLISTNWGFCSFIVHVSTTRTNYTPSPPASRSKFLLHILLVLK